MNCKLSSNADTLKILQQTLIRMSLVRRGLTGVIIARWRRLRNNGRILIKTPHSLLRNQRRRATIVPARIKANVNINDANLEPLHSVSINRVMSPRNNVVLELPLICGV